MQTIQNERRDFLKWFGLSTLSASGVGNAVASVFSCEPIWETVENERNLWDSFVTDDLQEVAYYVFLTPEERNDSRRIALFFRDWTALTERIARLKNATVASAIASDRTGGRSSDSLTILLSDETQISLHIRPFSSADLRTLAFFNGSNRSVVVRENDSQCALKWRSRDRSKSNSVCYEIRDDRATALIRSPYILQNLG